MILLIGENDDPHLTEINSYILNSGYNSSIFSISRNDLLNTSFTFDGNQIKIKNSDLEITSSEVLSAFCISPFFKQKNQQSSPVDKYWEYTWKVSLFGFYDKLSREKKLINHNIHSSIAAQNKIDFFSCETSKIKKPKTLISNNKEDINKFISNTESVLKTLHQMDLILPNGEKTMMLVKKISANDLNGFSTDKECPIFLQERIEKKYDVRCIIINKSIISIKIDASKSIKGKQDWRAYDLPNTLHEQIKLPNDIEDELLLFCNFFKLAYACIDLCVDNNDMYWILDLNPFGRFLWIEELLNIPISSYIGNYLIETSVKSNN